MRDSISLNAQIRIQKQHMWISVVWACLILLVGIALTVYFFRSDSSSTVTDLFKTGPLFISTVVMSFPWKDCMRSRARIATYRDVEKKLKRLSPEKQEEIFVGIMTDLLKETVKFG